MVEVPGGGSTRDVMLTTYKVVIDANDAEHARWLREALTNDGYRVYAETHRMVSNDGAVSIETERLRG